MDGWKNETSIFNTTLKKRDIFVQKKKKKKREEKNKYSQYFVQIYSILHIDTSNAIIFVIPMLCYKNNVIYDI